MKWFREMVTRFTTCESTVKRLKESQINPNDFVDLLLGFLEYAEKNRNK